MSSTSGTSCARPCGGRLLLILVLVTALTAVPHVVPLAGAQEQDGAGFTDVAGTAHAGYIEAIAAAGITSGCRPDRYCPSDGVTRGQMAAFLQRAFALPPADPAELTDIAGTAFEAEISAVVGAGIASGFPDGTFRPGDIVTRGQMATFLTNALALPPGTPGTFPDVPPDHTHAAAIASIALAEITTGFPDGTFRPGDMVTRGQMATFLGKGLGLEPILIEYPEPIGPDPGPTALVSEFITGSTYIHNFTIGTDTWEVWLCRVPPDFGFSSTSVDVDLDQAIQALRSELVRYFDWLSEEVYEPIFSKGGTFTLQGDANQFPLLGCLDQAASRASGVAGVLAITDEPHNGGVASTGVYCLDPCEPPLTLPHSRRGAAVGAYTITAQDLGWTTLDPRLATVAHEMGHALGFPHSFADGTVDEYSDPIDVMSGGDEFIDDGDRTRTTMPSTIAVNRFSAGWLGVRALVHAGGDREYTVGSVGYAGTQLVAVPSQDARAFTAIGALTRKGYDQDQPAEGVTLHRLDQRPAVCFFGTLGDDLSCDHASRRQAPLGSPHTTEHVLQVGQSRDLGGVTVEVLDRVGDGFRIRVSGDVASFATLN